MIHARLPYKDDDQEAMAFEPAAERATTEAMETARAALARAEADHAQAVYWMRRATAGNRDVRRKHLEAMTRAALEAVVALRRAMASA